MHANTSFHFQKYAYHIADHSLFKILLSDTQQNE